MKMVIDEAKCVGCGLCVQDCIRNRLTIRDGKAAETEIPCLFCSHCLSICPQNAVSFEGADMREVQEIGVKDALDPEALMKYMKFRRSIRSFTNEPVSDELAARLIEAGRYAPTASNNQGNRFVILRDRLPEITGRSLKVLYDAAVEDERFQSLNYPDVYQTKWISMYERYRASGEDRMFYHAPCVILVIDKNQTHNSFSTVSAGLAAANIEQMANVSGLGACYIGFFQVAVSLDPRLREFSGLKQGEELAAVLAVGHPAIQFRRTALRFPADVEYL